MKKMKMKRKEEGKWKQHQQLLEPQQEDPPW
jgi:hypothetical protein